VASKAVMVGSVLFHGALGVLVYQIEGRESRAATAIEMAETRKREAEKPAEPPKPPPEPPKRQAKRAAAPEKLADAPPPPPAPLEALPDFGLELSGGIGGGLAVERAVATSAGPTKVARAQAPVVKRPAAARPSAVDDDPCVEPPAKPRPVNVPQPAYTDRAREAGVEGKVRVELTVDETGRVIAVRVLQGLGYGLDEAAVAAAERASFAPAVRCGKPSRATFTMGIRFSAT